MNTTVQLLLLIHNHNSLTIKTFSVSVQFRISNNILHYCNTSLENDIMLLIHAFSADL